MRIKNLEIEPERYFYKTIYIGVDHGVYYYDDYDQKNNLKYPEGIDTINCRKHYLFRLNDDHAMYLIEILSWLSTKSKRK